MMGGTAPVFVEDPLVTMKYIFGDLHPEGQQASMTSLVLLRGRELIQKQPWSRKLPWTKAKRRRSRARRAFHPPTLMVTRPSSAPDISPI